LTGLRYGDDVVRWATLGEALRAAQEAERQAMMARLEYGDEGGAGEVDA
jgi:hypothetical protein